MKMNDTIFLENVVIPTRIGVVEEERKKSQPLQFGVWMRYDTRKAAESEDLNDTLDYETVYHRMVEIAQSKEWILVETLCQRIADMILEMGAEHVRMKAVKLECCISGFEGLVGIEIERSRLLG